MPFLHLFIRSYGFSLVCWFDQFSLSVVSDCLWPLDCSMWGFPIRHQLPEPTQTHVNWFGDAIQPSRPLMSPSPPAFNVSQHQGLFQSVNIYMRWSNYWSFSFSISLSSEYSGLISFRMDWFDLLAVQGLWRVFSNTTVQKHQFFSAQLSLWSNFHICIGLLGKP